MMIVPSNPQLLIPNRNDKFMDLRANCSTPCLYQFCWDLINTWGYNVSYNPNNSTFSDCKISGAQILGTKFCTAAPHICRYSVSNFRHVSLRTYKNFRWFLEFLGNLWIPGLGLKMVLWPF